LGTRIAFLFYNTYLYATDYLSIMIRHLSKYIFLSGLLVLLITSCESQKTVTGQLYDPKEVAELSDKLGIRLSNTDKDDDRNMPLYAESSLWLGVPYRYGGLSRKGLDCSGFTYLIYQKVYRKKIPRNTSDLAKMNMHKISKGDLQTGDLVFFATAKSHKRINHVGIYLKDGLFVHASTSNGVIVSHLNEGYYSRTWQKGGRIK